MNLLDRFTNLSPDQNQGLLSAGFNMLANSGPSRTPTSLGQVAAGGFGAYQASVAEAEKKRKDEEQMRQMMQMRQMQMQELQGGLDDRAGQRAHAARFAKFQEGLDNPAAAPEQAPAMPQGPGQSPAMPGMMPPPAFPGGQQMAPPMQPQQAPQQQMPQQSPLDSYEGRMARAKAMWAAGYRKEAEAEAGKAQELKPKVKNWQEVNVGGKIQYAPYFEDGSSGRPVPLEVARKLDKIDSGQSNDFIDPYTGQRVSSFGKKQTLESIASNATARRGQDMTDSRQRDKNAIDREGQQTQIISDPQRGPLLVNKGTGVVRQGVGADGQPIQGEAAFKKEASAKSLIPILDKAEKLLDGATGSYVGAAADQGMRWFGGSNQGSQNIAQLKVMEGQIMMNQPRMEGPQSNMDVELYRQMAGKIGDPTVPAAEKKAAFKTLREITNRYAGVGGAGHPDDVTDLLNKYGGK